MNLKIPNLMSHFFNFDQTPLFRILQVRYFSHSSHKVTLYDIVLAAAAALAWFIRDAKFSKSSAFAYFALK